MPIGRVDGEVLRARGLHGEVLTAGGRGPYGGGQGDQQQRKKTRLIITTQDGKTMEMEIDGEVKKIEARPTGAAAAGGGGQGGGGEDQGSQGGQS